MTLPVVCNEIYSQNVEVRLVLYVNDEVLYACSDAWYVYKKFKSNACYTFFLLSVKCQEIYVIYTNKNHIHLYQKFLLLKSTFSDLRSNLF